MNTAKIALRAIYWAITGALAGVGFIAILSIGVFLLAPSAALFLVGALRGWWRELWAGAVGFGLAPMLILLADLQDRASIQPASTADTYQMMAIAFGAIAVVGLLAGIIVEASIALHRARQVRV